MLDVTKVGADLPPAQQDETLSDLAFFLDAFGSTRAVRVKLQEQERDVRRFGGQLRRLMNLRDESSLEHGEIAINDNEHTAHGVDATMEDLDFFLRTFGSTHAVRTKLETQRCYIVGLQRTVQWLHARQRKADKSEICGNLPVLAPKMSDERKSEERGQGLQQTGPMGGVQKDDKAGGGSSSLLVREDRAALGRATCSEENEVENIYVVPTEEHDETASSRSERDQLTDVESGGSHLQPLSSVLLVRGGFADVDVGDDNKHEMCGSKTVSLSSSSDDGDFREQTKAQQKLALTEASAMLVEQRNSADYCNVAEEKPAPTRTPDNKSRKFCTMPGCQKMAQFHGLCCHHGGYRMCKADGCNRRAATQYLCPYHGGGTKCKIDSCERRAFTGRKGYCNRHAREQGIDYGKCKVGGCFRLRAGREYCQIHTFEGNKIEAHVNEHERSTSQSLEREDTIPYQYARGVSQMAQSSPIDTRAPYHVTCRSHGCMKWVMRDGDLNAYCPKHRVSSRSNADSPIASPTGAEASFILPGKELVDEQLHRSDIMVADGQGRDLKIHLTCKEPGCPKNGKHYGVKKGYCFQHGGGFTCSQPGCNRERALRGLCVAHGGYHVCKSDGCGKRAFVKGFCHRHNNERSRAQPNWWNAWKSSG